MTRRNRSSPRAVEHGHAERSGERLSDKLYETIRGMIVRHDLTPGSVLNERELMQELGVGRTPLREAIQRLAMERFVVVLPRYGAFVASISMGDLSIITEVRIPIEGYCAALAAQRRTDDEIDALDRLLTEASDIGGDFVKIGDIDQRLHVGVAEAARNEHLLELVHRYHALTARMWHSSRTRPPLKDQMMHPEWDEIVSAIRRRAPDEAEEAMRRHITLSRNQLHQSL